MTNVILKALLLLALPTIAFVGGVSVMRRLSGQAEGSRARNAKPASDIPRPLNQRLAGYDVREVGEYWGSLVARDSLGLDGERRALEVDLVFPFVYGGALAIALLLAWAHLGRPFQPAWVVAPVVITLLADWSENLVQLSQLRRYVDGGEGALRANWVQVASAATAVKLLFFVSACVLLLGLSGWMIVRLRQSSA